MKCFWGSLFGLPPDDKLAWTDGTGFLELPDGIVARVERMECVSRAFFVAVDRLIVG